MYIIFTKRALTYKMFAGVFNEISTLDGNMRFRIFCHQYIILFSFFFFAPYDICTYEHVVLSQILFKMLHISFVYN